MPNTATEARKPFTSTTWAGIAANQSYLSRDYAQAQAHRIFWQDEVDLAYELQEIHPHLSDASARALVDLCVSQVPVVLTWKTYLNREDLRVETQTNAVIIEHMSAQFIRVRYCGFGHMIQLSQIVSAESFQPVITYSD